MVALLGIRGANVLGSENGDVHTAGSRSTKLVDSHSVYHMTIACVLITENKVSTYDTYHKRDNTST